MIAELQIENIKLSALQNAEHYEFMSNANSLIKTFTAEILDVTTEYPVFAIALEDEDKSFKIVQKSALTKNVEKADKERDLIFSGMYSHIKTMIKHYDSTMAAAAYRVQVLFDSYGNLLEESYDRESAGIVNLLQDLNSEKYKKDVEILSLNGWISKLNETNNTFRNIMKERSIEQSEKDDFTRLRIARLATDDAYRIIRNKINAGIIFNGEKKYKTFVLQLNVYITRFNDTIAQRRGVAKAKKEEQESEGNE